MSAAQEDIEKKRDLVIGDRLLKIRDIAETVGISYEPAQKILVNELEFPKISARWVSRLLSIEQKRNRLTISHDCLELFVANPQEFLSKIVTVDETWLHHCTSESKQQSKNSFVAKQVDGICFFLFKECYPDKLSRKG